MCTTPCPNKSASPFACNGLQSSNDLKNKRWLGDAGAASNDLPPTAFPPSCPKPRPGHHHHRRAAVPHRRGTLRHALLRDVRRQLRGHRLDGGGGVLRGGQHIPDGGEGDRQGAVPDGARSAAGRGPQPEHRTQKCSAVMLLFFWYKKKLVLNYSCRWAISLGPESIMYFFPGKSTNLLTHNPPSTHQPTNPPKAAEPDKKNKTPHAL